MKKHPNMPDSKILSHKRMNRYKELGLSAPQIAEKEKQRCLRLILIGNFLEYYDLSLFISLLFVLNPIFLPEGNESVAILGKVFMFCAAYFMRPVGALFWGWIGDRYGRVHVLTNTMILMGIASMAITAIPSYQSIGIWSSILVILCRFLQGFAAGGEVQAAFIYFAESSTIPKAYFRDGLISSTTCIGFLFASLASSVCLYFFPEKGWMIPFWLGSCLAFFGTWARQTLKETPEFIAAIHLTPASKKEKIVVENVWQLRFILSTLYTLVAAASVFAFSYCPEQLSKMGYSPSFITAQSAVVSAFFIFTDILWGYIAYKTNKPFTLFKAKSIVLPIILLLVIFFPLPQSFLLIAFLQLSTCFASGPVPLTPLFIKAIPVTQRCRTMMLVWSLTKAIMYFITSYLTFWLSARYGKDSVLWLIFFFSLLYVYGSFRTERLLTRVVDELTKKSKKTPNPESKEKSDILTEAS
ncbi:MAG: MFS transporter [Alphaproteobacteria bacterium]|nr:MFS transporter [Alphaproteobacteria bacterium]